MSPARTCATCSFRGTYASQALADFHHRRHSCERHQRLAETARRRPDRVANRFRRDCSHQLANHIHGTRTAYVKDHCRCQPCTAANAAQSRTTYRERAYGRWNPYLAATTAQGHVRGLRCAGYSIHRIATLASVSPSTVRALVRTDTAGKPTLARVRPNTARRILSVQPGLAARADHSTLDALGTRRRLQALVAIGWTLPHLAARLSRTPTHLRRSMAANHVTTHTALQISDLYDQLWNIRPAQETSADRANAHQARAMATQKGWPPPLAWDDINSDPHPDCAQPAEHAPATNDLDQIAVERAIAGDGICLTQLTLAEQLEVVRRLTHHGRSIRDIAAQLNTTTRTISRRRKACQRRGGF